MISSNHVNLLTESSKLLKETVDISSKANEVFKNRIKNKYSEIGSNKLAYATLLGDFIGTLRGVCANDIPLELKVKLEAKIKELEVL